MDVEVLRVTDVRTCVAPFRPRPRPRLGCSRVCEPVYDPPNPAAPTQKNIVKFYSLGLSVYIFFKVLSLCKSSEGLYSLALEYCGASIWWVIFYYYYISFAVVKSPSIGMHATGLKLTNRSRPDLTRPQCRLSFRWRRDLVVLNQDSLTATFSSRVEHHQRYTVVAGWNTINHNYYSNRGVGGGGRRVIVFVMVVIGGCTTKEGRRKDTVMVVVERSDRSGSEVRREQWQLSQWW